MLHKSFRLPILLVFCLFFSAHLLAQNKSFWKNGYYKDVGNSYIETATGEGYTIEEARNAAVKSMIAKRLIAAGGGQFNVNIEADAIKVTGNETLSVQARIIDEDIKQISSTQYQVRLLIQMAKNPSYSLEPVEITDKYNCIGQSFIPGMAQLKKGQTGKGIFFIAAEAACVGTIIASESQRSSYSSKMNTTTSVALKKSYKDKANTWSTVRNIAIAGTAAFYIWNVVDGITAKGKKHIRVNGVDMAFAPYYTPESLSAPESSGLAMRITF